MDKDIREKIAQGRQVLDLLEKLASGQMDLEGCKEEKCDNCGGKHPTLEDAMRKFFNTKPAEKKKSAPRASEEEAKRIKKILDEILYRSGGTVLMFPKDKEDGTPTEGVFFGRSQKAAEILSTVTTGVKQAYEMIAKNSDNKEEIEVAIRKAIDSIFE